MSAVSELVATGGGDAAIVVAIVLSRLILPLFILRYPLITVAAHVLDAADQTMRFAVAARASLAPRLRRAGAGTSALEASRS